MARERGDVLERREVVDAVSERSSARRRCSWVVVKVVMESGVGVGGGAGILFV